MGVRLIVASSARTALGGSAAQEDDTSWEFAQARIVLGRSQGADVVLPDPSASGRHATIEADGQRYTIIDHGSLNGTWINGQRLVPDRQKPLRDGDRIDVGRFALRFVSNVPVNDVPSRERTSVLARRLLRQVRGDAGSARARVTVSGGPDDGRVTELPPAPARLVIGRGEQSDVVLSDGDASRDHAELLIDTDGVVVRDLRSKNGIFVGEVKVTERRLADRDVLRIGATSLIFEAASEPSLHAIAALPDAPSPPPAPSPVAQAISAPSLDATSAANPLADPAATAVATPAASALASADLGPQTVGEASSASPSASLEDDRDPHGRSPRTLRRGPALAPSEVAVYILALVVFVASAAGLWWLLGGP